MSELQPKAADPALLVIMPTSQELSIILTHYDQIFDVFRPSTVKSISIDVLYVLFVQHYLELAFLSLLSSLQLPYYLKVAYISHL